MMKCVECEGKILKKKVPFLMYGVKLGNFEAEVCTKCGDEVFDEKVSDKIDVIAKEKGLWGLGAKTHIAKYGNSLVVRIPKKIATFMHLREGKEAYIHPGDKNKIVIEA